MRIDIYVKFMYLFQSDYKKLSKNCNLWRNYGDIQDSWESVKSIMRFYVMHQDRFGPFNGPGHWNDPDMVFFVINIIFLKISIYILFILGLIITLRLNWKNYSI